MLKHIPVGEESAGNIKIENCIGFARVPIGLAGPLTIHGEHQKDTVSAPLATVEATLVASCSRGCKVLQKCGGVYASALSEVMSRAPTFRFRTVTDAVAFYKQIRKFEPDLKRDAEATSNHLRLLRLTPHIIGTTVHVKFEYSCGDATGQNMTTIATHSACQAFISQHGTKLQIIGFQLEGQFAGDKKAAWGSIHDGRGVEVVAWATLTDDACKNVLGLGTFELRRAISIIREGGIRNGQLGSNVNTANTMAAIFIACGQDAASVFEAGFTHLTTEFNEENRELTLSMYIPCLPVGTIGGGTGYPTQREALELINCYGEGKKWALAETIASFALALDISTISAMGNDTFSLSHERFARDGSARKSGPKL